MKTLWNYNKEVNIEIQKKLGNTYTHPYISEKIVQGYCNKKYKNVLEPSVGSGSFYYAVQNSIDYDNMDLYDIDSAAIDLVEEDEKTSKYIGDFLTTKITTKYDLIITNPPYVSYANIEAEDKEAYLAEIRSTLDYNKLGIIPDMIDNRSDLYMYFYLKGLSALSDDGELVFLCADTWLNSKFGAVLKRIITNNFKIISVTSSQFYPFFEDETNAIILKIVHRTEENKDDDIKLEFILEPNFVIGRTEIMTNERFNDILLNENNTTNQLLLHSQFLDQCKKIENSDSTIELENVMHVTNGGLNFNSLRNEEKLLTEATKDTLPLFYQPQARVNKPANYKQCFVNEDIIYHVENKGIRPNQIVQDKAFLIAVINKFPLAFTFKEKCILTSKYYAMDFLNDLDIELAPILLNNIITLQSMELLFKTANKRSSCKNKNGSIKETSKKVLNKIIVPNFNLLNDEQIKCLLIIYEKYKHTQIFTIQDALNNVHYYEMQEKLFEFFDFGISLEEVINNTKEMYATRDRDLEYLGLPLVDL